MGKRYKLLKDLPTFSIGDEFHISPNGNLVHDKQQIVAYAKATLIKYPNILKDWFEEMPDPAKMICDLQGGDTYYYINWCGEIEDADYEADECDNRCRSIGNCFLTQEDAEKEVARRKAEVILKKDTKGFRVKEDTGNFWVVYYDHKLKGLRIYLWTTKFIHGQHTSPIIFATQEDARTSIEKHSKEWLTYLGVEE